MEIFRKNKFEITKEKKNFFFTTCKSEIQQENIFFCHFETRAQVLILYTATGK